MQLGGVASVDLRLTTDITAPLSLRTSTVLKAGSNF